MGVLAPGMDASRRAGVYALQDTRTPVLIGAGAMGLNVVLSLTFAAWFQHLGWMPHGGLALANSLATVLECVLLLLLLGRRTGGLEGARLRPGLLASLGAGAAMTIVLWVWLQLTGSVSPWIVAGGGVVLGALIYFVVALALGAPEARRVWTVVTRSRQN